MEVGRYPEISNIMEKDVEVVEGIRNAEELDPELSLHELLSFAGILREMACLDHILGNIPKGQLARFVMRIAKECVKKAIRVVGEVAETKMDAFLEREDIN